MPPPSKSDVFTLSLLPNPFFVIKVPELLEDHLSLLRKPDTFFSITRTPDEVSIVGELGSDSPPEAQPNWRCLKIRGPMGHELTGVMAALTEPLGKAGVPIFAISTWNTDYVLIDLKQADFAMQELAQDGWLIE